MKEELEAAFQKIGATLTTPVEAYLLGGGAMCFRNQKAGTKDLDLIFRNISGFKSFVSAIEKMGFLEAKQIETVYADMMAAGIWKDKADFRMDLFVNTVCRALSLSDNMANRAIHLGDYGKLAVKLVSNEDVILFKGITERPDDTNDIAAILQRADVDWEVVLGECISQSKTASWYGLLYNKFAEIEERHGIDIPIAGQILKFDRQVLVKNAFEARKKKGMRRKDAIADLRKKGFTRKELEGL